MCVWPAGGQARAGPAGRLGLPGPRATAEPASESRSESVTGGAPRAAGPATQAQAGSARAGAGPGPVSYNAAADSEAAGGAGSAETSHSHGPGGIIALAVPLAVAHMPVCTFNLKLPIST